MLPPLLSRPPAPLVGVLEMEDVVGDDAAPRRCWRKTLHGGGVVLAGAGVAVAAHCRCRVPQLAHPGC